MAHLLILIQILLFAVSVTINYYFYHLNKSEKKHVILAFLLFITFNNIDIFIQLLADYFTANLSSSYHEYIPSFVWSLCVYVIAVSILYSFVKLGFSLLSKKISTPFNRIFISGAVLFWLLHVGISIYYTDHLILIENSYLHFCTNKSLYLIPVLLIIGFAIFFLFENISNRSGSKGKSLNYLFIQFIAGYIIFFLFSILETAFEIMPLLVRFYINIFLVFWFSRFYFKSIGAISPTINDDLIKTIRERYGISKREQDVLHLILQGKNNKEIEGGLFISSSTVRNHVSAIYKKIGVSHRGQLINVILKLQKEK